MIYDVITIGDCMRDVFVFPAIEEMEEPVSGVRLGVRTKNEDYLVFGLGEKIDVADAEYSNGGTAANVAAGLSKLGLKTGIVSVLGSDTTGGELKKSIEAAKVSTDFLKVCRGKKSSFSVIISYKGERTIFVYHAFGPSDFKLPEEGALWYYLGPMRDGYEKLFAQITSEVIKSGIKIAINPGEAQIEAGLNSFGGLLNLISVIFLNREEALKLSGLPGTPTVKDMAKVIHFQGPRMVVITDGPKGAYAFNGDDFLKVGPYPGHRLEATGAGDAFASGFLAAIMGGESMKDALKWGATNSASVVGVIGAQGGLLSKNIVQRRVKDYKWPAESMRFS